MAAWTKRISRGFLVMVALLQAAVLTCGAPPEFVTNGLVVHLAFDGDALDHAGGGNDGTVVGALPAADRFGRTDRSYFFGPDAAINVHKASLPSGKANATICWWQRLDDTFLDAGSFYTWHPFSAFQPSPRRVLGFAEGYNPGVGRTVDHAELFAFVADGYLGRYSASPPFGYDALDTAKKWNQMALVIRGGTNAALYVNGVPVNGGGDLYGHVNSESAEGPLVPGVFNFSIPDSDWVLGYQGIPGVGTVGYAGWLDEFRVYARSLSDSEIAGLYAYESVPSAPIAWVQPTNRTVIAGQTLSIVAAVIGEGVALQWQKDGVPLVNNGRIGGVTTTNLVVSGVVPGDAGVYRLAGSNALGAVVTDEATVTVLVAPAITANPSPVIAAKGANASLTAAASGVPAPSLQWFKDGFAVPGASNATLTLSPLMPVHIGDYRLVATSPAGSATSTVASVSIPGLDPRVWKGLAAYLPFDGDAVDQTPNGNHGGVDGALLAEDRFGRASRSYALDLAASIVVTNSTLPAGAADLSISWWQRLDDPFAVVSDDYFNHTVFGVAGPARIGDVWLSEGFHRGAGAIDVGRLNYYPSEGYSACEFFANIPGPAPFTLAQAQRWNHFVMVRGAGTNLALYQNGALRASGVLAFTMPTNNLVLGARHFFGGLDEFRAYTRALSAADVGALYAYESQPAEPVVLAPPSDTHAVAGGVLSLSASVIGQQVSFRWQKGGVPLVDGGRISGSTTTNLVITGASLQDAGSYALVASNAQGAVTTAAAIAAVWTAPAITGQPVGATVVAGGTAALQCVVTGIPTPSIQWFLDGVALAGRTNATLLIDPMTPAAAGTYTASVSNPVGSVTSNPARVQLGVLPFFTLQPSGASVALGGTFSASAGVDGFPVPRLQWYRDGSPLPGATNATLVLSNVRPPLIGDYRLVASNALGSAASMVASLSIPGIDPAIWKGLVAYYPLDGDAVDGSGNGRNGTVVGGVGFGADRFDRPTRAGTFAGTGGYVDCGIDPAFDFTSEFTLSVWFRTAKPQTSYLVGKYDTDNHGSYGISCVGGIGGFVWGGNSAGFAQANPFTGYADDAWHQVVLVNRPGDGCAVIRDGAFRTLVEGSKGHVQFDLRQSLTLGAVGSGKYVFDGALDDVRVYNRALSDAEVASLYAYESVQPQPLVVASPADAVAIAGNTLSLTAGVTGYQVAVRWQKDGVPLVDGGRISGSATPNLVVSGVGPGDAGAYRLVGTNAFGSATTAAATVAVLVPPAIVQQPSGGAVAKGAPFVLSVSATGTPAPSYQWSRDGVILPGRTNASLAIPAMSAGDAGVYRVLVSSPAGNVTSAAATVSYLPAIEVVAGGGVVRGSLRSLGAILVRLQFDYPDWFLFYTTDGTEPDYNAAPYSGEFSVAQSLVLRTVAYSPDFAETVAGDALDVVVLRAQTISTGNVPAVRFGETAELNPVASSGLPVVLALVSGPATLDGNRIRATGTGTAVLRASQAGNDTFAPAVTEFPVVISPAPQSFTWGPLPDRVFGDGPVGVTVAASSGLPVTLSLSNSPASVSGSTITPSGAGVITVVATQAGNGNYLAAVESRAFRVAKADQSIVFPSLATRDYTPVPFALPGSASSALPLVLQVVAGPASITQAGLVKLEGAGTVILRATQPGNTNYNPAVPVDRTLLVNKAAQTLDFASLGSPAFGDSPLALGATSSAGLVPVTFSVLGGPGTIEAGRLSLLGAGSILVQAAQAGNSNYLAAVTNQTVVVAKGSQSITWAALPDMTFDTNALALGATASSGLPVSYRLLSGPATLSGAQLRLTGVGTVTVAADQPGDENRLPAASVTNLFKVSRGIQTLTFVPVGDRVLSDSPVALQATSSAGLKVTFQVLSGPATVSSNQLALLGEGTVTVRAIQTGSPTWLGAQADQTFEVRLMTTLGLSVANGIGGTISADPLQAAYLPKDSVVLTAVPARGFVFAGWSGALRGTNNPASLAMSSNRVVVAAFADVEAPEVVVSRPGSASVVTNPVVVLEGTLSDNLAVSAATWALGGGVPHAITVASPGGFSVPGITLAVGTNTLVVRATDAAGNVGSNATVVVYAPPRVARVEEADPVREGQRAVFPVTLSSNGEVGGISLGFAYDTNSLADPQLVFLGAARNALSSIRYQDGGSIQATLSMPGTTIPAGEQAIAEISFRARSVPAVQRTLLVPSIADVSGQDGSSFVHGNAAVGAGVEISPRGIAGDNNANGLLDIGDAVVIQGLLLGYADTRPWDVPLNDLNQSGAIDSGDVIKVLRVVVGLDGAPGGRRLARGAGNPPAADPVNAASLRFPNGDPKVGAAFAVEVALDRLVAPISGLSLRLAYPTNAFQLALSDLGDIVPAGTVPVWAPSPGQVRLAVVGGTQWGKTNGVAARFTFVPKPGLTNQASWSFQLDQFTVTRLGYDISSLDPVSATVKGGNPAAAPRLGTTPAIDSRGNLVLQVTAGPGQSVRLQWSSDLMVWNEDPQGVTGQGDGSPVQVVAPVPAGDSTRFYRIRVQ